MKHLQLILFLMSMIQTASASNIAQVGKFNLTSTSCNGNPLINNVQVQGNYLLHNDRMDCMNDSFRVHDIKANQEVFSYLPQSPYNQSCKAHLTANKHLAVSCNSSQSNHVQNTVLGPDGKIVFQESLTRNYTTGLQPVSLDNQVYFISHQHNNRIPFFHRHFLTLTEVNTQNYTSQQNSLRWKYQATTVSPYFLSRPHVSQVNQLGEVILFDQNYNITTISLAQNKLKVESALKNQRDGHGFSITILHLTMSQNGSFMGFDSMLGTVSSRGENKFIMIPINGETENWMSFRRFSKEGEIFPSTIAMYDDQTLYGIKESSIVFYQILGDESLAVQGSVELPAELHNRNNIFSNDSQYHSQSAEVFLHARDEQSLYKISTSTGVTKVSTQQPVINLQESYFITRDSNQQYSVYQILD